MKFVMEIADNGRNRNYWTKNRKKKKTRTEFLFQIMTILLSALRHPLRIWCTLQSNPHNFLHPSPICRLLLLLQLPSTLPGILGSLLASWWCISSVASSKKVKSNRSCFWTAALLPVANTAWNDLVICERCGLPLCVCARVCTCVCVCLLECSHVNVNRRNVCSYPFLFLAMLNGLRVCAHKHHL